MELGVDAKEEVEYRRDADAKEVPHLYVSNIDGGKGCISSCQKGLWFPFNLERPVTTYKRSYKFTSLQYWFEETGLEVLSPKMLSLLHKKYSQFLDLNKTIFNCVLGFTSLQYWFEETGPEVDSKQLFYQLSAQNWQFLDFGRARCPNPSKMGT